MPVYEFPSGVLKTHLPAGQRIIRVHQIGKGALWFGPAPRMPPNYRFDAPAGEYRTLYAAEHLTGAFVETVLRQAKRIVGWPFVEARGWTEFTCKRDLIFAKAYDEGLINHGITADICTGDDYTNSRRFAADIFAADRTVDGIAYRARHNNGQICYAIFDRMPEDQFTAGRTSHLPSGACGRRRHHARTWSRLGPVDAAAIRIGLGLPNSFVRPLIGPDTVASCRASVLTVAR